MKAMASRMTTEAQHSIMKYMITPFVRTEEQPGQWAVLQQALCLSIASVDGASKTEPL
jgi:hypothetical protein